MLSPTGLYLLGSTLLLLIVAVRYLFHGKAGVAVLIAAAATAFEAGLLTDFGLPLPSGLLLVLAGIRTQVAAAGVILAVNLLVAWAAHRLVAGHPGGHGTRFA